MNGHDAKHNPWHGTTSVSNKQLSVFSKPDIIRLPKYILHYWIMPYASDSNFLGHPLLHPDQVDSNNYHLLSWSEHPYDEKRSPQNRFDVHMKPVKILEKNEPHNEFWVGEERLYTATDLQQRKKSAWSWIIYQNNLVPFIIIRTFKG